MSAHGILDMAAQTSRHEREILRQSLLKQRQSMPPETHAQHSLLIQEHLLKHFAHLARQRVGFYWPIKQEPDLLLLIKRWSTANVAHFAALLPVVVAANQPLSFRAWTSNSAMHKDRYGISTPSAGEFLLPEALLIPLLAFDENGYRLGYGGGFYDRTLAQLSALQQRPLTIGTIGIGFELARVRSIQPTMHDIALDYIVSEAGVFCPNNKAEQTSHNAQYND